MLEVAGRTCAVNVYETGSSHLPWKVEVYVAEPDVVDALTAGKDAVDARLETRAACVELAERLLADDGQALRGLVPHLFPVASTAAAIDAG